MIIILKSKYLNFIIHFLLLLLLLLLIFVNIKGGSIKNLSIVRRKDERDERDYRPKSSHSKVHTHVIAIGMSVFKKQVPYLILQYMPCSTCTYHPSL